MKNIKFHTDPGHGWLQVPLNTIQGLGISPYSYQDGIYAYLEEDSDMGKWLEARGIHDFPQGIKTVYYDSYAPMRQMASVKDPEYINPFMDPKR